MRRGMAETGTSARRSRIVEQRRLGRLRALSPRGGGSGRGVGHAQAGTTILIRMPTPKAALRGWVEICDQETLWTSLRTEPLGAKDRAFRRLDIVETGRRRRWCAAAKEQIVLESMSGPRQIAATARRNRGPAVGPHRSDSPEDGVLWICDTGERQTMAFTAFGIEPLKELITDQPCVFHGRWASISRHREQPFPASSRLADWFMNSGSMRRVKRLYCGGALAQAFSGEGQSVSVMDEPVEDGISTGRIADGFMPVLDRELADDLTSG
jgi:hypothetical protein